MSFGQYSKENKKGIQGLYVISVNGRSGVVTLSQADIPLLQEELKHLKDHTEDINNPHKVNKEQVGLKNVDNTSDSLKPISLLQEKRFKEIEDKLIATTTGFKLYKTEAEMKADHPAEPTAAIVGETGEVWYWDGVKWELASLSPAEMAKKAVDEKIKEYVEVDFYNLDTYDTPPLSSKVGSDNYFIDHGVSRTVVHDFFDFNNQEIETLEVNYLGSKIREKEIQTELNLVDAILKNKSSYKDGNTVKVVPPISPIILMPEDNAYMSHSKNIIKFYDDLVDFDPQYITKEIYGDDGFGNEISTYTFKPAAIRHTNSGHVTPLKYVRNTKILIIAGVHGSERVSMLTLMSLCYNLVHNAQYSAELSKLRGNLELVICPVLCPSGRNNGNRYNQNNVDLNGNYPSGWVPGPINGPHPLSEKETQYSIQMIEKHSDAMCSISLHGHGLENQLFWLGTHTEWCYRLGKNVLDDMYSSFLRVTELMDKANQPINLLSYIRDAGLDYHIFEAYGIPTFLIEMGVYTNQIKEKDVISSRILNEILLTKMIYQMTELDINSKIQNEYKPRGT